MLFHWEESATTKTAPFRRNPLGAGGFGPQALSLVGHDGKTSFRSSLRACHPKTPARGPSRLPPRAARAAGAVYDRTHLIGRSSMGVPAEGRWVPCRGTAAPRVLGGQLTQRLAEHLVA